MFVKIKYLLPVSVKPRGRKQKVCEGINATEELLSIHRRQHPKVASTSKMQDGKGVDKSDYRQKIGKRYTTDQLLAN